MTDTVDDTTIRGPLTLDDVAKRIDTFCIGYIAETKRLSEAHTGNIQALGDAIEASPDLDKKAAGTLVFARIRKLLSELQDVV